MKMYQIMYHVKFIYMTNKYMVLRGDYMLNVTPSSAGFSKKPVIVFHMHVESGSDDPDILGHLYVCAIIWIHLAI